MRRAGIHSVSEHGFSLLELVVSTGLVLIVLSSVFEMMHRAEGAFRAQPESMDVQQRLRVATDTLLRDLMMAGRGPSQGRAAGPLFDDVPSVLPFRRGRRNADLPGSFRNDTITILSVGTGAAQATIAEALPARSATVRVGSDPGCPPGDPLCGFRAGMDVIVLGENGAYDTFTVTSVAGDALNLQHNAKDSSRVYPPLSTRVVEGSSRTYFLKADSEAPQLMQYGGAGGSDVPVVDHVVALSFEYFGDPQPPQVIAPITDHDGPWTTYGPKPPASGENCVFSADASGIPAPRLGALEGSESGLVRLGASALTDGPWCPDESDPNRVDADLLRVRKVRVTVRVEAAVPSLRGPAGLFFSHGGTAAADRGFVPDQEIRFEIAPRNLNVAK